MTKKNDRPEEDQEDRAAAATPPSEGRSIEPKDATPQVHSYNGLSFFATIQVCGKPWKAAKEKGQVIMVQERVGDHTFFFFMDTQNPFTELDGKVIDLIKRKSPAHEDLHGEFAMTLGEACEELGYTNNADGRDYLKGKLLKSLYRLALNPICWYSNWQDYLDGKAPDIVYHWLEYIEPRKLIEKGVVHIVPSEPLFNNVIIPSKQYGREHAKVTAMSYPAFTIYEKVNHVCNMNGLMNWQPFKVSTLYALCPSLPDPAELAQGTSKEGKKTTNRHVNEWTVQAFLKYLEENRVKYKLDYYLLNGDRERPRKKDGSLMSHEDYRRISYKDFFGIDKRGEYTGKEYYVMARLHGVDQEDIQLTFAT